MKKLISVLLTFAMLITVLACGMVQTAAYGNYGEPYGISYPTQEQIIQKARELNINLNRDDDLAEPYNVQAPYAPGELSRDSQQHALNMLNLYRYIAGLPSDVELEDSYCQAAQAASLVNAANRTLSHSPQRPEDMSDELYYAGTNGAGRSNLASGYGTAATSVSYAWMEDSDNYNIPMVGHRRWVLNPSMKYTGFGHVGRYTAMYAFDSSRDGYFDGDYVAWPAPNTPIEMFHGSVFSVNLGSEYDYPSADKISIEVTSETLGKSWTINSSNPEQGFYVNNQGYGMSKCIIFRPEYLVEEDTIHIRINGTTKKGVDAPISYTVNLFSFTKITTAKKYVVMRTNRYKTIDISAESPILSPAYLNCASSDSNVAVGYSDGVYSKQEGTATIRQYTQKDPLYTVIVSDKDILLGDADGDDTITILDTSAIQRRLAAIPVTQFREYAADTDMNNEIDITDGTNIQRWLAGLTVNSKINIPMQEL